MSRRVSASRSAGRWVRVLGGLCAPGLAAAMGCGNVELAAPRVPLPEGWSLHDDAPYPRVDAHAVLDDAGDRLIVFGTAAGDTWEMPLSGEHALQWRQLVVPGLHPPSYGWGSAVVPGSGSAIYDPLAGRMIVLLNDAAGSTDVQLWSLALKGPPVWRQLAVGGTSPGPSAYEGRLTLDRQGRRVLVSRGAGADAGIWAFSLDGLPTWSLVTKGFPWPSGYLEGPAPVVDEKRGEVLFVAPESARPALWRWSLKGGGWSLLDPGSDVTEGWGISAAWDKVHDRLVLLGGAGRGGVSLFSLQELAWSYPEVEGVGQHSRTVAVADPSRDRVLFFGGETDGRVGNALGLLSFGPLSWQTLVPGGRWMDPLLDNYQGAAVWDPVRRGVVAFGYDTTGYRTLEHGLKPADDWHLLGAGADGLIAGFAASVYDPHREAIVSFGGLGRVPTNSVSSLSSHSPGVWEAWSVVNGPRERYGHTAVYDSLRRRMVVFGGKNGQGVASSFDDTWALSLTGEPIWTDLHPAGVAPSPRAWALGVYDPAGDQLLLLGGRNENNDRLSDLFALSLAGTPTWSHVDAAGFAPYELQMPSAVYDPVGQRMVIVDMAQEGARTYALSLEPGQVPMWRRFCDLGVVPAGADSSTNVVATPQGLFATVNGGAFRFSLETPYCDEGDPNGPVVPLK